MRTYGRLGLLGSLLVAAGAVAALSIRGPLVTLAYAPDSDSDGLQNSFETAYGTSPTNADSDGDNLNDWDEIFVTGTDPNDADTDGDGTNDDSDSAPLDDSSSGGSADGRVNPTYTWSSNLTAPALTGASSVDGHGVLVHGGEFVHQFTLLQIDAGYGPDIEVVLTYRSGISYDGATGVGCSVILAALSGT